MKNEDLKKIKEQIDEVLKSAGVGKDQITELTEKILKVKDEKDRKVLATEIVGNLFKPVIDEKKLIKAIENIKIEPQITVEPPKVELKVPEPKVIVREPTPPKVIVKPAKVIVKGKEFPKEFQVTGFASLIRTISVIVKKRIRVRLGFGDTDVSKASPLPVVLTHDSEFYKAVLSAVGGGPSRIWIKNKDNKVIYPVSEAESMEIENLTMTTGNTVYSYDIPDDTLQMDVKLRTMGASLLYSWSNWGEYMTIPAGGSRHFGSVHFKSKTIYLKSPSSGQVAEIECFKEL